MGMRDRCVCGCGRRSANRHHVIYRQHLRERAERRHDGTSFRALVADERNLVAMAFGCHQDHHARSRPLPMRLLPDSVFEFAIEVLGFGPSYQYLARYYGGSDPRHDAMAGGASPV